MLVWPIHNGLTVIQLKNVGIIFVNMVIIIINLKKISFQQTMGGNWEQDAQLAMKQIRNLTQ